MAPAFKRPRTRSPSPALPLHLYTSLPSSSCSTSTSTSTDPALARLPGHLARGMTAHEAVLLDLRATGRESGTAAGGERVPWAARTGEDEGEPVEVWTDRYDILHLLPSLPPPHASSPSPSSTRGFAHLPPTHEESFYLTPSERTDVERQLARRKLEEEREARVRAAEARDAAEEAAEAVRFAAETEAQLALMHRLHATLSGSPNPALLELRILAHHGHDARFAFLRAGRGGRGGRWRAVWERIRRGEEVGEGGEGEGRVGKVDVGEGSGGIAGLAAYGSSDEESEVDADVEEGDEAPDGAGEGASKGRSAAQAAQALTPVDEAGAIAVNTASSTEEDARREKQAAKAEKAREWARKRRDARGVEP